MAWWEYKTQENLVVARRVAWVATGFGGMFFVLIATEQLVFSSETEVFQTLVKLIMGLAFIAAAIIIFGFSKVFERIISLEESCRAADQRDEVNV